MSLSGAGAAITMAGGTLSLNGGGGSGGASLYLDGGHVVSGSAGAMGNTVGGAAMGGTATVAGNDTAGCVTLNASNGSPSGSTLITVNFNTVFARAPIVILTPANALAGGTSTYTTPRICVTSTTAGFTITNNGATLQTNSTYQWNYLAVM